MITKEIILEQNKLVQAELQGVAKGYEQALGWILSFVQKEELTHTVDTAKTERVTNQEK